MIPEHLKFSLESLNLTQAELARLIDVTPRAVSMWLNSERGIPGSVEGYLRLLLSLSTGQLQAEFARLNTRIMTMKDGMYKIQFAGVAGTGTGVLVFDSGRIFGADEDRVQYDGAYEANPATGLVDITMRVHIPAGQRSVIGTMLPYDWTLEVTANVNPRKETDNLFLLNPHGSSVKGSYEFLRALPAF